MQHKPFAIIYGGILNFKSSNSLNNLEIEEDEFDAKKSGFDSNFELVIFIKTAGSIIEKSEFFGKYRRTTVSPPEFEI